MSYDRPICITTSETVISILQLGELRQTNNFSKGTEPVKGVGGFEVEQSGYRGHTLKPLTTQSYDAVKSTNSFKC